MSNNFMTAAAAGLGTHRRSIQNHCRPYFLRSDSVVKSTNTHALLRGAVPKSVHTASNASLARYLKDRLVGDKDIHLDLEVSIER